MSNQVEAVGVEDDSPPERVAARAADKVSRWKRPYVFRLGSLIVVLTIWEILGPTVNPIFFTYPSAIVQAFFDLIENGELVKYSLQSLEILLYGMSTLR